jgi:hypothetical protein
MSKEIHEFVESYKIKLLNSSPYYVRLMIRPSQVIRH